jgi:quinol monooxygenase YgiN
MSKVSVIAKITAAEGKRDELASKLQFALDHAADEPGTLAYSLHADAKDEAVLWMYELYENQGALDAHMGADWFKELGPMLAGLVGNRPELIFCTPLAGKGL